jgi:hypothetical protein
VQPGNDQDCVGSERVPAANHVAQPLVKRIEWSYLKQVEDHVAAHPDIRQPKHERGRNQRI